MTETVRHTMLRHSCLRSVALAALPLLALASVGNAAGAEGDHGTGIAGDLPLWGMVAFIGFLFAFKKLGWEALTSSMKTREETENRLIADAESLRERTAEQLRKNQGLMAALNDQVQHALEEAQRDANHTRQDIRGLADREAGLTRQRTELEINRVRDQSLNDVFASAASRIAEQAERRIREQLTPAQQQRLIDAALQGFVSQN